MRVNKNFKSNFNYFRGNSFNKDKNQYKEYKYHKLSLIFSGILALTTISHGCLLCNQNKLINSQDQKLNAQLFLSEAEQRSSHISLCGSLIESIRNELTSQKENPKFISKELASEFISLTQILKPYFIGGAQIDYSSSKDLPQRISPEKGLLLSYILNCGVDDNYLNKSILPYCNFTSSELSQLNLKNHRIIRSNLSKSSFAKSNLDSCNLFRTNFIRSDFRNASLKWLTADSIILSHSKLGKADFRASKMNNARMNNVKARLSNFRRVELRNTMVKGSTLDGINLSKADIRGANFSNSSMSATYTKRGIKKVKLDSAKVSSLEWFNTNKKLVGIKQLMEEYFIDSTMYTDSFGDYHFILPAINN